jgi:glyoxylate/hydroxypyruvate reductase A
VWEPQKGLLAQFTNLKAILSVGAGVDPIIADPSLPNVPIVKMVDSDLTMRMTEYVVLHVLIAHRKLSSMRPNSASAYGAITKNLQQAMWRWA